MSEKLEIKTLEDIEIVIFEASLAHNPDIQTLGKIYSKLTHMRNQISFVWAEENLTLQELEEILFRISESILNIRIMIREEAGLDINQERKTMKQLWGKVHS